MYTCVRWCVHICKVVVAMLRFTSVADYISFAAHTDYEGTSQFIRDVKPPHIVC